MPSNLDWLWEYGLEDGPVEDGVADADEGHHDVLAEEARDVRRDLLPEVREEVRDLHRSEIGWVRMLGRFCCIKQ